MEASQVIGDAAEECSSCESGWTMYLSSPAHHADDDGDDDDDSEVELDAVSCISSKGLHAADEDDDDSMASDASTGGIQRNHSCGQFDVTDDDEEEDEENSNGAYGGFGKVECCNQYHSQRSFTKRMRTVQEASGVSCGMVAPSSEVNVVSDSKIRHDIVAGQQLKRWI